MAPGVSLEQDTYPGCPSGARTANQPRRRHSAMGQFVWCGRPAVTPQRKQRAGDDGSGCTTVGVCGMVTSYGDAVTTLFGQEVIGSYSPTLAKGRGAVKVSRLEHCIALKTTSGWAEPLSVARYGRERIGPCPLYAMPSLDFLAHCGLLVGAGAAFLAAMLASNRFTSAVCLRFRAKSRAVSPETARTVGSVPAASRRSAIT
jgi:hypothetical protein